MKVVISRLLMALVFSLTGIVALGMAQGGVDEYFDEQAEIENGREERKVEGQIENFQEEFDRENAFERRREEGYWRVPIN